MTLNRHCAKFVYHFLFLYIVTVERLCAEIKIRAGKLSSKAAKYCFDEYRELVKGKFSSFDDLLSETDRRNEAEHKTEHVATYIYQCCTGI